MSGGGGAGGDTRIMTTELTYNEKREAIINLIQEPAKKIRKSLTTLSSTRTTLRKREARALEEFGKARKASASLLQKQWVDAAIEVTSAQRHYLNFRGKERLEGVIAASHESITDTVPGLLENLSRIVRPESSNDYSEYSLALQAKNDRAVETLRDLQAFSLVEEVFKNIERFIETTDMAIAAEERDKISQSLRDEIISAATTFINIVERRKIREYLEMLRDELPDRDQDIPDAPQTKEAISHTVNAVDALTGIAREIVESKTRIKIFASITGKLNNRTTDAVISNLEAFKTKTQNVVEALADLGNNLAAEAHISSQQHNTAIDHWHSVSQAVLTDASNALNWPQDKKAAQHIKTLKLAVDEMKTHAKRRNKGLGTLTPAHTMAETPREEASPPASNLT